MMSESSLHTTHHHHYQQQQQQQQAWDNIQNCETRDIIRVSRVWLVLWLASELWLVSELALVPVPPQLMYRINPISSNQQQQTGRSSLNKFHRNKIPVLIVQSSQHTRQCLDCCKGNQLETGKTGGVRTLKLLNQLIKFDIDDDYDMLLVTPCTPKFLILAWHLGKLLCFCGAEFWTVVFETFKMTDRKAYTVQTC